VIVCKGVQPGVKLKTGEHREGIKGQKEGKERKNVGIHAERRKGMKDQEPQKERVPWGSQERQEEKKETKPQVERRKGKERKEKRMLGSGAVLGGYPIW